MTPNKQEVDQMANFMRALNTQPSALAPAMLLSEQQEPAISRTPLSPGAIGGIQEMKSILERFYTASQSITEEASSDPELREALMTERTSRGSRIGEWEIQVREDGKRKFYDVVQIDGSACIASDLLLYEAAHGLVRILNGGGKLNSKPALGLLRAEQDYASALNDAVLYKHYIVKNPRGARTPIYEAKYSAAKQRAIAARDTVTSFAGF